MRKLIIAVTLILLTGLVFGQTIQKGAVLTYRIFTITPEADVTMNQYLDFYCNKYIPEFEKHHPGIKLFLMKPDRGKHKNGDTFGLTIYFESIEVRNSYWSEPGKSTALKKEGGAKMKPVNQELRKLGSWSGIEWTDWIIQ